ncbi:hypothetical protein [Natrialba asiatica]|uniref:hypothetical protein n=1 Tax=Natrialba asiatica TaxID=64602 RepID=UPI001269099B|nr:hypothetical protein [Natrialba asiatica]
MIDERELARTPTIVVRMPIRGPPFSTPSHHALRESPPRQRLLRDLDELAALIEDVSKEAVTRGCTTGSDLGCRCTLTLAPDTISNVGDDIGITEYKRMS